MKKVLSIILLAIVLFPQLIAAQTVAIEGEVRPRVEYRDGFSKPLLPANDPGVCAIQRTRLNLSFTSGIFNSQITLQDSRTYGQTPNAWDVSSSAIATTGLYEAWAEMVLIPGGSFKIGKQVLKYDDSRLFSGSDWSNTGTTHDAALFKYSINDFQAHLAFVYNNNAAISSESYYTPKSNYRYLGLLWFSKDLFSGLNLTGIAVDEGVQDTIGTKNNTANYLKTKMYHAYTLGGNLKYTGVDVPITATLTAYFQTGKNSTGSTLAGDMLSAKASYKFTNIISASLAADYLSGDVNSTDGIQSNFKKLYGSDHSFNGSLEYWKTPLTQGLLDYYAGVTAKVDKNLTLEGSYHIFNSEYAGKNKKGIAFGKDLGSEIDITVSYKLNAWTTIQGGWSTYFTNNNTFIAKDMMNSTTVPTIRTPQWAYLMFTIKPKFL